MFLTLVPGRRWILGIVITAAACRSYAPQPLDPEEILARIVEERDTAADGEVVSLREAAELMRQYNPELQRVRAAYATEQAFADVKTPLPNPTVELVPIFTDVASLGSDKWGGEFGLGWTILLAGKRRLTDELNAIRAEAASIDVLATEREQYLALRDEMLKLAMAGRIDIASETLYRTADIALKSIRAMVRASQGTALDVLQFEQELYQAEVDLASSQEVTAVARANVAARAGVSPDAFKRATVPNLPGVLPERAELQQRMLRDHPALSRLRAEYTVAEKELQLEIAYQYPDLNIGGLYDREEGDNKFGIGIGIEIPLFDRNQPAIARADARRNEVRDLFEAQVRQSLADIDTAYGQLAARMRQLTIVRDKLEPVIVRTLKVARRSLEAGSVDSIQFLTVVKDNRSLRIRTLRTEQEVLEAWAQLESACGSPMLVFPEEPDELGEPVEPASAETKENEK